MHFFVLYWSFPLTYKHVVGAFPVWKACVDLISYLAVTPFLCFLLQQNLERIVQILAVSNFSLHFCLKLTQINPVTSRLLNPLVGSSYSSYLTNQRHLTCSQPSFSTHFRNCPPWLPPASQSFSRSFFTHQPVQLQGPRAQSYILFPTNVHRLGDFIQFQCLNDIILVF